MPDLPNLTVQIPGPVSSALMATPESDKPLALAVSRDRALSAIQIPARSFRTYALVYAFE